MSKIKTFFSKLKAKIYDFDIYKNSVLFFVLPLVVILVMIICGTVYQLSNVSHDKFANIGVDFQGGTLLTVEFGGEAGMNSGEKYKENLNLIKTVLKKQGFDVAVAQSSGDSSIVVRYLNTAKTPDGVVDYNNDEKVSEMNAINEKIKEDIELAIKEKYGKDIEVRSTATLIGNSASLKLLKVALISVSVALALMLLYIIIRFDVYSALAAIAALLHDIIIMMSLVVIFYVEIGSTIVAAIITIVAYSINNTIIVFDRIRSEIKPYKKSNQIYKMSDVINASIKGTMTRTLYTTLTTLVVIALLTMIGVASIRTFALPILFGLIAGFYSSVFLAAPMWGVFKGWGLKIKTARKNRAYKRKREARA